METFLIKALQLILSLSILVIVHEFGHFLFARVFKIRVEKFYLFFNPWFSLFKFKPKNSDTEYGIGWLPLGGYVKISGMIDESMDKEQMAKPAEPWEFRSKPAWQRLLVMVGGVLFNFILALFIYSMMLFTWGDEYIPLKDVKAGMVFSDVVKTAGFQDRDILVSADGHELSVGRGITDINALMAFVNAKTVDIVRDGQPMQIQLPVNFADSVIKTRKLAYSFWAPAVVDSVLPGSKAEKIGLQAGDSVFAIGGNKVASSADVMKYIKGSTNKAVRIQFIRQGVEYRASAVVSAEGTIGIMIGGGKDFQKQMESYVKHDNYGFFESFPMGIKRGVQTLKGYVAQIRFLFSKEGVSNLSGFGGIGSMFPATWDWQGFWSMTAFLSIVLAFMNILPIPALDGGHILFLLYEVIARRAPSQKFLEYAQTAGMILLIGLLLFANGNDILRFFFK